VSRNALDAGADANLEGGYGFNLLMLAAAEGNVPIGRLLIARGADPNRVAQNGWCVAFATLSGGHLRFLELLLEHGANPNCRFYGRSIDEWPLRQGWARTATLSGENRLRRVHAQRTA
jgi:ankyrin repeat protein